MSPPWRWISASLIYAVHEQQLAEHGGPAGGRDPGALESALGRPRSLAAYGEPDAAALAAAYAFGIARTPPFTDGNKRTAWIAARLFLADNGFLLRFDKADAVRAVLALAAGELSEEGFGQWLRERVTTL